MENTLSPPVIRNAAEAEAYVERVLGEIRIIRDQMKSNDLQTVLLREETARLKEEFALGATEGETRIREMNLLLDRLFPATKNQYV